MSRLRDWVLKAHYLPPPLHRLLLRGAHRLRVMWWRSHPPRTPGVSVIARDEMGRVLLVRHSYGSGLWSLPGGGLSAGEDPADGAIREFAEELCCPITHLEPLVARDEQVRGITHRVNVFTARLAGIPRPDGREVIAAQLFALDALPPDLGRLTRERLALLPR